MKKINETYLHEDTGIQFDVEYKENKKILKIKPSFNGYKNNTSFVFNHSNPETVIKIGKALLDIGNFCKELK
jgi:hypothetical protein